MRILSSFDCLKLWEAGVDLHPLDRGLLAVGAAEPEIPPESLADWPLGRRNLVLARLHCSSFGRQLHGWTTCHHCGEKLEIQMDGGLLADGETQRSPASTEPVFVHGRSFRVLTTRDLAKAAREIDVRLACQRLAESCQLEPGESPAWNDQELEEIGQCLALADPLAETQLALYCPVCEQDWLETLDIFTFLWREIELRARQLLTEVHLLASTYGWTETEILSLSESRRRLYLELVQS
jgi:hypothetical protein